MNSAALRHLHRTFKQPAKPMKETSTDPPPKKRRRFSRVIVLPLLLLIAYGALVIFNSFTKPAADLGVNNGRLAPCPDMPNCVSSQASQSDKTHYIEALTFPIDSNLSIKEVTAKLRDMVDAMPRTKLIEETEDYLRFEFTTAVLRFVDDVELYVTEDKIHVRSASRIGRSDLGANRKRVETIRNKWETAN